MADNNNEGVFVVREITNQDIYDILKSHGSELHDIKEQTTETNGKVAANLKKIYEVETCIKEVVKPKLTKLESSNIILFCIRYKVVIITLLIIGALLAIMLGLANVKSLLDFLK